MFFGHGQLRAGLRGVLWGGRAGGRHIWLYVCGRRGIHVHDMIATTVTVTAAGLSGIRCSWAEGQRGVIEVVAERGGGGSAGSISRECCGERGAGAAAKCYWHFVRTKLVRFTLFIWL